MVYIKIIKQCLYETTLKTLSTHLFIKACIFNSTFILPKSLFSIQNCRFPWAKCPRRRCPHRHLRCPNLSCFNRETFKTIWGWRRKKWCTKTDSNWSIFCCLTFPHVDVQSLKHICAGPFYLVSCCVSVMQIVLHIMWDELACCVKRTSVNAT